MDTPWPTELFVYGTLRHDQPEHARHCRGVDGWRPARLRGRLFRIAEGYLLLVLPTAAILHRATDRPEADEARRRAIARSELGRAAEALTASGGTMLAGELLSFRDAAAAWPPLDAWEGTSSRDDPVYARVIVPVETGETDRPWIAAWVYAAVRPPAGAVELPGPPPR